MSSTKLKATQSKSPTKAAHQMPLSPKDKLKQKGTNSEGKSVTRYALHLGAQKINIHQSFGEFSPSASASCVGALDFCLLAEET